MASDTVQTSSVEAQGAQVQGAQEVVSASEAQSAKRTQFLIIGGAVVILVLVVIAVVLMARSPAATQVIRDIAIVFVAVTTFLIGLAMLLLIIQIQVLIQVLRDEIQPLLRSVNDMASTARGTTEFVSHNVVTPIIRAAGFTAAARRVLSDVMGILKVTTPHSGDIAPQRKKDNEV